MTDKELWQKYIEEYPAAADAEYDSWQFGDDPDTLAELVRTGRKTATSSAYVFYELEGEELPREGEYSIVLDSENMAVCIIRNTRVYVTEYGKIDETHARREGEGDLSLKYWREVHERFFREELSALDIDFNEKIKVVCEEFELVYKA